MFIPSSSESSGESGSGKYPFPLASLQLKASLQRKGLHAEGVRKRHAHLGWTYHKDVAKCCDLSFPPEGMSGAGYVRFAVCAIVLGLWVPAEDPGLLFVGRSGRRSIQEGPGEADG